mgnify:CR=1 FL=1
MCSGTTGQAAVQLNKEDGDCRKYILYTINDNNICEEITGSMSNNVGDNLNDSM